ncbi:MAG: hypothetical protein JSV02_03200 [Dehalococcoidia bacterium]|nr:MAG: hypothetical protein JSV02_03200 [Dehalococcoidia bacterium]
MVNAPWQVTATKVYCEAVEDDTIIMVKGDWDCLCTYYGKWGPVNRLKRTGATRILSWMGIVNGVRQITADECKGPADCQKVRDYQQKYMLAEKP